MTELTLENVSKKFGTLVAVDDVNLRFGDEDFVSVVGPNGAGKTTLFNLIKGVNKPTSGDIYLNKQSIVGKRPDQTTKLGVSRAFQEARTFHSMSLLENIRIAKRVNDNLLSLNGITNVRGGKSAMDSDIRDILNLLDLDSSPDRNASSLPYAERKLCAIGMALATDPEFLLLDEPVAGMNPTERKQMEGTLMKIIDGFNTKIILIEHDMDFVTDISDRIVVLNGGRVISRGTPNEVVNDPQVIEAYLGSDQIEGDSYARN